MLRFKGRWPEVVEALSLETKGLLVHVGAHEAEEWETYRDSGFGRVIWVEPNPVKAAELRARFAGEPDVSVLQAACSDTAGQGVLHILEPTNMCTMRPLHPADRYTGSDVVVPILRVRDFAPDAQVVVIDAQGFELEVLHGCPLESEDLKMLVVETSTVHDPTLAPDYDVISRWAATNGWVEIDRHARDYKGCWRFARGGTTSVEGEILDLFLVRAE